MRHRLFLAAFTAYAGVVSAWLLLGLAATLAERYPELRSDAFNLSMSAQWPGPVRALARGIAAPTRAADQQSASAILDYLFSAMSVGLGFLLVHLRGREVVVRLLALGLVGSAGAFNLSTHRALGAAQAATGHSFDTAHIFLLHAVAGVCYVYALLLFPEGRFVRRRRHLRSRFRWPARILRVLAGNVVLLDVTLVTRTAHTRFFVIFYGVLAPLAGIAAQRLRIRSARSAGERQQSKLLLGTLTFAVATAVGLALLTLLLTVVRLPGFASTSPDSIIFGVFRALSLIVPLAVIVGVMRYRLWNIERFFSRALRYGILAVFVTGAYTVTVLVVSAGLGRRAQAGAAVPVLATCLVAVAFQPIRERVRLAADRLVYGRRPPAEQLMSELTGRLASAPPGSELLSRVAEVVGHGLRATQCRVAVHTVAGEQARTWPDGLSAPATGWDAAVPVVHLGETIGAISLSRPAGERLDADERRILADIGRQAGPAFATLRLNADLRRRLTETKMLAGQLRESCRQIVATGARERRRLERDIHDGAQQQLLALRLALGAVDGCEAGAVRAIEDRLVQARESLLDLARGMCPPVLARSGLAVAIRDAAEISPARPCVRAAGLEDLRFPRQIESAAYFCCLEALNNCVRHANGSPVQVDLRLDGGEVVVAVSDAGPGFDWASEHRAQRGAERDDDQSSEHRAQRGAERDDNPARRRPGTGLAGMAERLAAVGGRLEVWSAPGQGTAVTARLPAWTPERPPADPDVITIKELTSRHAERHAGAET